MSDHMPVEIQVEIMKRLPIKSLIRFRCVSKTCKSLIESCHFIIAHYYSSLPHTQPLHLFASQDKLEQECLSVVPVDDDPFPPVLFDMIYYYPEIIGCSHGLLCLYGIYKRPRHGPDTWMAVIWNLSIKKAFAVVMPDVVYDWHEQTLGFGVPRETADLKIVRITPVRLRTDLSEVEVFTLSTGAWRSSYGKLPRKSIGFYRSQVVIDGFLYWLAFDDLIHMESKRKWYVLIISFDLTTEEFREVNLPDCLASKHGLSLMVSKLRESLVVIEEGIKASNIWMMDDGGFTKLYTVNTRVRGIMNSGEPIIQVNGPSQGHRYYYSVAVYEPYSELIKNLGISGNSPLSLYPYMETLLLLDQPDFIIYDQGRRYVPNERAKILKEQNAFKAYQQGSRKTLKLWMFSKEKIIKVYRRI